MEVQPTRQAHEWEDKPIKSQKNQNELTNGQPRDWEDKQTKSYEFKQNPDDERHIVQNKQRQDRQYQDDERPIKPNKQQQDWQYQEEERPIKANKQQQERQYSDDERPIKPNKSQYDRQTYPEDERPIKPNKQLQDRQYPEDERPIKPNKSYQEYKQNPDDERPIKPNKQYQDYKQNLDDERPIKPNKQLQEFKKDLDDERPIKSGKQSETKQNADNEKQNRFQKSNQQGQNTPKRQQQKQQQQLQNDFDEQQIKPLGNKFNDQFEGGEVQASRRNQQQKKINEDEEDNKRPFLKRGTRKFLSSALVRSKISEKVQAEIIRENNAALVMDHMQDFKKDNQLKSKRSDSPPIKSKFVESNLYGQQQKQSQQPTKTVSNKENHVQQSKNNLTPSQTNINLNVSASATGVVTTNAPQIKKSGNFLTKGEGRGGGKGGAQQNSGIKIDEARQQRIWDDQAVSKQDDRKNIDRFDDEEEWGANAENDSYAKMNQKAKLQKKIQKQAESEDEDDDDKQVQIQQQQQVQKSKLVQKYYGQKDKQALAGKLNVDESDISLLLTAEQEESIVRRYVQDKIDALNNEIAKFKQEGERARKERIKYEDNLKQQTREREEWEKQREQEKQQIEDWKDEEYKKLQKEKKIFERNAKVLQNTPSRKEREEIEQLKKALEKAMEELKIKDSKNKLNVDRLKKQCDDLEKRNSELQNEIRALENMRLKDTNNNLNVKNMGQVQVKVVKNESKQQQQQQFQQQQQQQQQLQQSSNTYEDTQSGSENGQSNDEEQQDTVIQDNNNTKKVQFVQSSYVGQAQNQKRQDNISGKLIQKNQYDLISIGDMGRFSISMINDLISEKHFCYDQNRYYLQYIQTRDQLSKITNQNVSADGKIQRTYANGKREVIFQNGVKREVFQDGYTIVHFTNNDVKQTLPNGTIIYYFADANTTQTTLQYGPNIYRFANKQIEIHFPDQSKEIRFCDGTEKYIHANGEEETSFSDGIFQKIDLQKIKYIEYPNGNVDIIHPDGQKIRQFKNKEN